MSIDDKKLIMTAFEDGRSAALDAAENGKREWNTPPGAYKAIIDPEHQDEAEEAAYKEFVKTHGDPHAVKEVGEFVGDEDDMTYEDWAHKVHEDKERIDFDPCENAPEWSLGARRGHGTAYDRRMTAIFRLACDWGIRFKDADDLHTQMWGVLRQPIPFGDGSGQYVPGLHLKDEDKRDLPNVIEAQFQYFTTLLERKGKWQQLAKEARVAHEQFYLERTGQ